MAKIVKLAPGAAQMRVRLTAMLCIFALLFLILIGGLFYRQIIDGPRLREKALSQWTRTLTVTARRGDILDRNGVVLATSSSAITVVASPNDVMTQLGKTGASVQEMAQKLCALTGGDEQVIASRLSDTKKSQVVIARQLRLEEAQKIRDLKLPGLSFQDDQVRGYPQGNVACQLLGFTDISLQGQEGLERALDAYLKGINGKVIATTDSRGRQLSQEAVIYQQASDGNHVELTLDYVLQSFTEQIAQECYTQTGAKSVQALMMNVKTGEILVDCTYPSFDLNHPPRDNLASLQQLSRHLTVSAAYEPGSTFKILTTASALDCGVTSPEMHYTCSGSVLVNGDKISCWRSGNPHGNQSLKQGFMNSCNPVFVRLALNLTKERFYQYLEKFGLGHAPDTDLPSAAAGQVISIKYVKDTDLARMGFGQSVSLTPLQLLTAAASTVNGGNLLRPYVIKRILNQDGEEVLCNGSQVVNQTVSADTCATMREFLEAVVTDGGGRNAYVPGYRIGGKTGTAQKYVNGMVSRESHICSFLGFAPMEDPQIGLLFIVDEPSMRPDYGSTVAAPYAGMILEDALHALGYMPAYEEGEEALAGIKVPVPAVVNLSPKEAQRRLAQAGLRTQLDGDGEKVVEQLPHADTNVSPQSLVILYTTSLEEETGLKEEFLMPDLQGLSMVECGRLLRAMGLKMVVRGSGFCTEQSIAAQTLIKKGTTVIVTFA